jgi:hypothetical protein
MDSEKPTALLAVDDLRKDAKTPEDHAYLDAEQAKVESERAQALGGDVIATSKLVELPDGSTATEQEVQASRERGEDPSGPYDGGTRQ